MATSDTVTIYGATSNPVKNDPKSKKRKVYGLGFPMGSRLTGGFNAKESGASLVKSNIKQILLTEKGERVMLPNFGCNLRKYLFQPIDEVTFNEIKNEVLASLAAYAPNVSVIRLKVESPSEESNAIHIILLIRINDLNNTITEVKVSI